MIALPGNFAGRVGGFSQKLRDVTGRRPSQEHSLVTLLNSLQT